MPRSSAARIAVNIAKLPELLTQVTVTTPVSQVGRRNQAAG
jgi:hypothetical protein